MSRRHPWRDVLTQPDPPMVFEGRGSVLGPDTSRRTRWWEMNLSCGHQVERTVRYRPRRSGEYGWGRTRRYDDILPHPKRVRCEQCPPEEQRAQ